MWSEDKASFNGKFYRIKDAYCNPETGRSVLYCLLLAIRHEPTIQYRGRGEAGLTLELFSADSSRILITGCWNVRCKR